MNVWAEHLCGGLFYFFKQAAFLISALMCIAELKRPGERPKFLNP